MRLLPGAVSARPQIVPEDWARLEDALDMLATTEDEREARATEEAIYEYFRRRDSPRASRELRTLAMLACLYLADGWLLGPHRPRLRVVARPIRHRPPGRPAASTEKETDR
jgi:hypothetical protein